MRYLNEKASRLHAHKGMSPAGPCCFAGTPISKSAPLLGMFGHLVGIQDTGEQRDLAQIAVKSVIDRGVVGGLGIRTYVIPGVVPL